MIYNSNVQQQGYRGNRGNQGDRKGRPYGDDYNRQQHDDNGNDYNRQRQRDGNGNDYDRQRQGNDNGNDYDQQRQGGDNVDNYDRQRQGGDNVDNYDRQRQGGDNGNNYNRQRDDDGDGHGEQVNPVGATLAVAQNTHHRRSIRLVGYDYSKEGMYFVTICCHGRICRFGHINGEDMILNEYGQIAFDEWINLKGRYPYVSFDVFQLMPNHLHGIIDIPRPTSLSSDTAPTATLGNIVGAYKSLVMRKCLDIYKAKNMFMGNFWQRNYYEHIIRDQESYDSILEYILNNPAKWKNDSLYMDSNKGL